MTKTRSPNIDPNRPTVYQIRIKGHLSQKWTDWFGGLSIAVDEEGDTILTGLVADQAALHGLLRKVCNLGMPLLSVIGIETDQPDVPEASCHDRTIDIQKIEQFRSEE
jgi:hypothetical protein